MKLKPSRFRFSAPWWITWLQSDTLESPIFAQAMISPSPVWIASHGTQCSPSESKTSFRGVPRITSLAGDTSTTPLRSERWPSTTLTPFILSELHNRPPLIVGSVSIRFLASTHSCSTIDLLLRSPRQLYQNFKNHDCPRFNCFQ